MQLSRKPVGLPLVLLALCALLVVATAPLSSSHPGLALDLRTGGQDARAGTLDLTGARVAFAALEARAAVPLTAVWDSRSGTPVFLAAEVASDRLPYTPTAAEQGNPLAIARGFLDANRALFRLGSSGDLQFLRAEPDPQLGFSHFRLAQVYHGIPVFGKQLVVHLDAQNQVVAVNGRTVPGLRLPTVPSISAVAAETTALQDLLENQLEPAERANVSTNVLPKTELTVYVDERYHATLTWHVNILTERPLGSWDFFVNAGRPVVTHVISSAAHAKQRQVFDARNRTALPGKRLMSEGERSRDAIAQAAYDSAGKVYDYYFTNFKRDSLDGRGLPIISSVHYGSDPEDSENAAWIGDIQQIIYGDGGDTFKPLAGGLDVVGHELTHGVIDFTSQLVYETQSGALNESYADVFGALVEGKNWLMGEEVIKSPPYPVKYLRSLEDPTAGGMYDTNDPLGSVGQPGDMSQYANLPNSKRADNGGVHINSGIPSHAAFLVAQAIGKDKMQQIYYRTMTEYLQPDATFLDAANQTIRAAQDLFGASEVAAIQQAFAKVGINVKGGNAPVPTPPEQPDIPSPGGTPDQPQQLPAGCTELLENGGFEDDAAWSQVSSSNSGIIDPELPYSGTRSAWLGGSDQESIQYIYQDVKIPANANQVELSYYRFVHREIKGTGKPGEARFTVALADTKGQPIATIEEGDSSEADDTWHQATFDLSEYAGKTIRLVFAAENPRKNISSMFVDDVSLAGCTGGSAPQAPQTGGKDLVYLKGTIANIDTGRGVEGATLFVIKPGLSATDAAADDTLSDDEILTSGVSDAKGVFQTDKPIPRNQAYSVVVFAKGYRTVIADDGLAVPADASNPYPVDADLRKGR